MTKYYVDVSGNYIGGFCEAPPPVGAIEVPTAPNHAKDKWVADTWVEDTEEQFKAIERRIEKYMDEVAQTDGWDNRWSCVARAGYVNPWQAKGIKFAQWMDTCWAIAIQAQNDVIAGARSIPTPEQAVAELPSMVW